MRRIDFLMLATVVGGISFGLSAVRNAASDYVNGPDECETCDGEPPAEVRARNAAAVEESRGDVVQFWADNAKVQQDNAVDQLNDATSPLAWRSVMDAIERGSVQVDDTSNWMLLILRDHPIDFDKVAAVTIDHNLGMIELGHADGFVASIQPVGLSGGGIGYAYSGFNGGAVGADHPSVAPFLDGERSPVEFFYADR